MRQPGFFDVDERLKRLSNIGDQLEAMRGLSISRSSGRIWLKR